MLVAYILVDSVTGNVVLSCMDRHSGYNKIFIIKDNVSKTTFRYPNSLGTYELVIMPFELKNAKGHISKNHELNLS